MSVWHKQRSKKITGGKYHKFRDKKKRELGREPALTKVSDKTRVKKIRTMGGNEKLRALMVEYANVLDKEGKFHKVKIKKVLENKASRHYPGLGIITKGAIIETEIGKAKVTNRPGQEGHINAVQI